MDLHRFALIYTDSHQFTPIRTYLHQFTLIYTDLHRFTPIYTDLHQFTPIYRDLHRFTAGRAAQRGSAPALGRGHRAVHGVRGIARWFLGGSAAGPGRAGARCCRGVPTRGRRLPANGAPEGREGGRGHGGSRSRSWHCPARCPRFSRLAAPGALRDPRDAGGETEAGGSGPWDGARGVGRVAGAQILPGWFHEPGAAAGSAPGMCEE